MGKIVRVQDGLPADALIDHIGTTLARVLPVHDGPYTLTIAQTPEPPLLWDGEYVLAQLHLDALDRQGAPWSIDQTVHICSRGESDLDRVTAIIEALARVTRRVMRDVQDDRFGERPWFGLVHLAEAARALARTPARRACTVEACEAVMLGVRQLRDILAPPAGELEAAVAALDAWLATHATLARTPTVQLAFVLAPQWPPMSERSEHGVEFNRTGLFVTVQLTIFDEGGVRDVKEQQLLVAPARMLGNIGRVIAMLEAAGQILPRVFARLGDEVDMLMPHDLLDLKVLDLKKPRTADELAGAMARRWHLDAKPVD